MPLLRLIWTWFAPRVRAGTPVLRIALGMAALVAFAVAVLPTIGFEVVRRVDRGQRLSIPVTWIVGTLAAVVVLGALRPSGIESSTAAEDQPATSRPTLAAPSARQPSAGVVLSSQPVSSPTAPVLSMTPSLTPVVSEPPLGTAPVGATETARVVRVVDGDTIVVDRGFGEERVRYIGVDTPETVDPSSPVMWMGPEASAANMTLVEGKVVVLEKDVSEIDRYGRLLRYVWLEDPGTASGWILVNLALVAEGFAQVSTYPPDVRYVDLFLAAQEQAREAEVGLWGAAPTPKPTPKPTKAPADCHPSYIGECLRPDASDYDCAGGSGNGPYYVYGTVRVVGPDVFDLDRDNDGYGCE